jgi:hypothetical protein
MDDTEDQGKEEELTLYEVYSKWQRAMESAYWEVCQLRQALSSLKETEHKYVIPHFQMPLLSNTTTGNINYFYTFAAPVVVPVYTTPANVEFLLSQIPELTVKVRQEAKDQLEKLDISRRTILALGVLKKAKASIV